MYDQFTPFNTSGTTFKEVLECIIQNHESPEEHVYHLSKDGMSIFITFPHDDIVIRRQSIPDDENRHGVLSKAKGQLARVALVLHWLEQAVHMCNQLHEANESYEEEWSFIIQDTLVVCAVELINHFIDQKFALMPAEEKYEETDPDLAQLCLEQRKFVSTDGTYIRKLLLSKHASLTPSLVSQLRLMPPSSNTGTPGKTRYPVLYKQNVFSATLWTWVWEHFIQSELREWPPKVQYQASNQLQCANESTLNFNLKPMPS